MLSYRDCLPGRGFVPLYPCWRGDTLRPARSAVSPTTAIAVAGGWRTTTDAVAGAEQSIETATSQITGEKQLSAMTLSKQQSSRSQVARLLPMSLLSCPRPLDLWNSRK